MSSLSAGDTISEATIDPSILNSETDCSGSLPSANKSDDHFLVDLNAPMVDMPTFDLMEASIMQQSLEMPEQNLNTELPPLPAFPLLDPNDILGADAHLASPAMFSPMMPSQPLPSLPCPLDMSFINFDSVDLQAGLMSAPLPVPSDFSANMFNNAFLPPTTPLTPILSSRSRGVGLKNLCKDELATFLRVAGHHGSSTRSKRDLAIICLLIDAHMSCGMITALTLVSVSSIIECIKNGEEAQKSPHAVELPMNYPTNGGKSRFPCHPLTVWALERWLLELKNEYDWELNPCRETPLFVNALPVLPEQEGQLRPVLRQIPLKRDAICKILTAVKQRSGIQFSRRMMSTISFDVIGDEYLTWENTILAVSVDK
jgi:hypothetical protein